MSESSRLDIRVALGQFAPENDPARNRNTIEELAREAAVDSATVLLLPEEAMIPADAAGSALGDVARAEAPRFLEHISRLATKHGIYIVAPGFEPSPSGLPYNTVWCLSPQGRTVARYRKMHLYDAFGYQESRQVARGCIAPTVFTISGVAVGLINCYDLRFPEHSRALAEQGADLLFVSAAWAEGEQKVEHWSTLLKARAIENTCWVAAVGSTGVGNIGHSMAIDPLGIVKLHFEGRTSALDCVDVSLARIDEVRRALPVLRNRRLFFAPSWTSHGH